jgi:hypothetical protein
MRLSIHSQNRLLQTSDNIGAFLEALGYQMDFEFVREGCALSLSSLFSLVCLHFLVDTHTHFQILFSSYHYQPLERLDPCLLVILCANKLSARFTKTGEMYLHL